MSADPPPLSAERLRRRGMRIAALFLLFALLLLAVGAWLLAESQAKDRAQLRERYATGATVASAVIDSLLTVAFTSGAERAADTLALPVTTRELDAYIARRTAAYVALADAQGRVLAGSSRAPDDVRAVVERVGQSGVALGDVHEVDGQEMISSATRFGEQGPARFLVNGYPLDVLGTFLTGSIAPLVRYGGDAYVIDGNGRVLGAVDAERPQRPLAPSRELRRLSSERSSGLYSAKGGERFFAGRPVPDTSWKVLVAAPTEVLYRPASGVSRWLPWVVLGILALALLAIGALVRRAVQAGARIAVANAQLESSQDRLRDRAIELQASNAELQRSNAELEQFAYVASHDLSAPLRAVAGFSQLLGVRYRGRLDADADQFIGHMQDGVERMQRIIDDLLTYSRVGRSGLKPEPLDLDAVLDEVLRSLTPDIAARAATVTRQPLGEACGEPGQLSQVLQNLISNALKFTADGVRPQVDVSAERASGRVYVRVRDNGIGIDAERSEQIFKMFQRLHGADHYEGTGIGLAIAKKIVDRHGGDIAIEPAPGGGTIFTFDVPATMPD